MPDQTTTGSRIKRARVELGLSLPQLARQIVVDRQTLEDWENDQGEPRGAKLMKLAGVLQAPMIWLLTGDTPQELTPEPVIAESEKIAQKLERALAVQQDLAALLTEVSADVTRLRRQIEEDREMAA